VNRPAFRVAVALLAAWALSACVESASPILAGSQPVFGERLNLQFYSMRDGRAHEPNRARYAWKGGVYSRTGGSTDVVNAFSVHPFEGGDYIVQTVPAGRIRVTEYGLMHKLADGVFKVIAIDEDDADEATRAAHCRNAGQSSCRIETREQLFAFARASAKRQKTSGGLVIRLAEGAEPKGAARRKPGR
jgi:hypothetical protein